MRLQRKFLTLLLPTGLAAASLILFLIRRSVHAIVLNELERSSILLAKAAAQDAGPGFQSGDETALLPVLHSLQKREGALYAAALDSRGTVVAHTSVTEKGRTLRDAATDAALRAEEPVSDIRAYRGDPILEVSVPVWAAPAAVSGDSFLLSGEARLPPKRSLGLLKVALPLAPALETERRIMRWIFSIVVAIGGLSLAMVLLLVRGILTPIHGLMAGIARISGGRYDVEVPVMSQDELGELALSFNAMSGELARTTVSKEYVEGILENMADILVVTDLEGGIETANHAATEVLSYSTQEMAGRALASLFESSAFREQGLATLLKAGGVRDLDATLKSKSGRAIPVLFSASGLKDRDGRLRGYVGVAKDMTERKRIDDALLAAKTAAEAASKELEAFSYSVAHDLKAPLRAVDGFSQALLTNYTGKLDAEGQDFLQRVRAASKRMGTLIDDLLSLSRVTRSVMRVERVDLSGLAREIAENLKTAQPERAVEFVLADGVWADGDPGLLRVILDNLLGNSWKYTGRRPRARIEFGETRRDGQRIFFVRDDGAGFDMAFAKKLFAPFSRLHTTSEFEGTGIGLATVQRVVARHGGRIWGESEVEKGAAFYFTLQERTHGQEDHPARRG